MTFEGHGHPGLAPGTAPLQVLTTRGFAVILATTGLALAIAAAWRRAAKRRLAAAATSRSHGEL